MRHSQIRANEVEYSLWLVFDAQGSARLSRAEPAMAPGERGMHVRVTLPKAIFRTPVLQAIIAVPDPKVDPAGRITAEVKGLAEAALKEVFGVDVKLEVLPPT